MIDDFISSYTKNICRHERSISSPVKEFLTKPFFKKLFYSKHGEIVNESNSFTLESFILMMENYVRNVSYFHYLYENQINFDLIQQYTDALLVFRVPEKIHKNMDSKSKSWIQENILFNSHLNMISMEFSRVKSYDYLEYNRINKEYGDIISMIEQIIKHDSKPEIVRPMRFREFHNKLVRIHLRATIKNVEYSQYFLNVPYRYENYEIREPKNSYELAEWATTVKNCVYSYQDRILNGSSAIFLVSENGTPKYTVEVSNPRTNAGSISEMEKIYKTSMTQEERKKLTSLISPLIYNKPENK